MQLTILKAMFISLLVALVFQLYPWSGFGVILRPDFLLVVMLYWLLRAPYLCNIGVAWTLGLLMDLSTGSLMGQHGLSFAITAFIGLLYQRRLVLFNQWQLLAYVVALLSFHRMLILIFKLASGNQAPGSSYILPIVTSLLLWKVMIWIFGDFSQRKRR